MKLKFKNVAFAIATVALAGVIAHQAYAKQQEQAMSDVLLKNVEALSDDESTGLNDCDTYCTPKPNYTCYLSWGEGIDMITCPGYGKK
ncbi:MAG: hypothetical protein IJZ86_07050 [Bacteroides sp.]|nr:hypothetical protein [Bacteroides sp.]